MVEEFEKRLAEKENPEQATTQLAYSQVYEQFKNEQRPKISSTYEKLANSAGKILKLKVSEKDRPALEKYLTLSHLNVKPEYVNALAILSSIPFIISAILVFFLFGSLFFSIVLFGTGIFAIYYGANTPKFIFQSWRAKASDQILIAVLYIVIYMKKEPNLERAILFVAQQLPPPLSLDFMKVLWDIETKKYSTIEESLESYLDTWKDSEPAFVDAMHLVESSLTVPDETQARKVLEKATDVITTGIEDNMTHFAHNLKNPIQMIHMLGIVLPLLMLVMMPMVGAFLADAISAVHLILVYNVILPTFVFFLSRNTLAKRPGGAAISSEKLLKGISKTTKKGVFTLVSIGFFLMITIPVGLMFVNLMSASDWSILKFENSVFYLSIAFTFALGIAVYINYHFKNKKLIKLRENIEKIEDEFSSAIFQLGNRIGENIPAESAFGHVAQATRGSQVSDFFSTVDSNIRQKGMNLEAAIFDQKTGAATKYPSPLIISVMRLLVESVKKSPKVAAESMTTLSLYLQKMHQVKEKMTDLLSDTLSSMRMQVSFVAPLIAALVISLSVLITRVLSSLSGQLSQLQTSGIESQAGLGTGITGIFQVEAAIPPYLLQLMIGLYIIQVGILLSYLISGIIKGSSKIDFQWTMSKNVLSATLIYCALTVVGTIIFSSLAFVVTTVVA